MRFLTSQELEEMREREAARRDLFHATYDSILSNLREHRRRGNRAAIARYAQWLGAPANASLDTIAACAAADRLGLP